MPPRSVSRVLGLLVVCLVVLMPRPAVAARPNVLFLAIDDLNDWVGPLGGHPMVRTPHLDRLARRGVTFANAHCQAPLCNPSRTSVLTGLRPTTTGVYALNAWFRDDPRLRTHRTLPQHFAQHGYRTLGAGKVFHDAYPPAEARRDGIEFVEWGPRGGFRPLPPRKFVETPDPIALMDWGEYPERDEECFDADIASWAVKRLGSLERETPFFMAVGLRHPHVPLYAPAAWWRTVPDTDAVLPPVRPDDRSDIPRSAWFLHWRLPEPRLAWLRESGEWRPMVRGYLASIHFVDAQVGRILDALDASGHRDDTWVVVWSDHGFHLGEKGISGKNSLWERSTRVPLILMGPGIPAGRVCDQPVELLDLYPTLAAGCGLPVPSGLDGHSLVPQLRDAARRRRHPAITTHGPGNHAVRDLRWRYIRYADGAEELYDLRMDRHEWTNRVADPRVGRVKRRLARFLPGSEAPPLGAGTVRLAERRGGIPWWEGRPIGPEDPVPGDE